MSLKFRYYTFVLILHLALTVLLYLLFEEKKQYFLLCEVGILISLFISYKLYQLLSRPFEIIDAGQNAIADEDFTIKYNKTGTIEMDTLISVYNEMIDRLRKEKTKTEEQSYFLENLFTTSPLGMIIMDYDHKIVMVNDAASKLFKGYELKGHKLSDLNLPFAKKLAELKMYHEKIITIEGVYKYKCKNHEVIHKGFPRQFILIEELTQDILKAEKVAYGKVIRMMAHEVNNSMGAVNSILQSIKEFRIGEDASEEEMREYLEIAIDRNKSLGKFTDNFATVIRLPEPLLSKIDLNDTIYKTVSYYKLGVKEKNISFDLRTYPEPVIIKADKIQLEQALSNIIKNSIESIGTDGNIIITTDMNPSRLIISDNGKGISEEHVKNLFTPFYSTKESGQGIGLMLIRDIFNNHNAKFKLYTDPQTRLTHFEIIF